jgi:hypothetical protein
LQNQGTVLDHQLKDTNARNDDRGETSESQVVASSPQISIRAKTL